MTGAAAAAVAPGPVLAVEVEPGPVLVGNLDLDGQRAEPGKDPGSPTARPSTSRRPPRPGSRGMVAPGRGPAA